MTWQTIDVRGTAVSLYRQGAGDAVLFLHGEDGARTWLPCVGGLAASHELFIPELPGFGASEVPEWLDSIHDLAYFYLSALDGLRPGRVHLVGYSLGGWIALEMAIRDPARLKSLTLIASAGIHLAGVPRGDYWRPPPEEVFRSLFADPARAQEILSRPRTPEDERELLKRRWTIARVAWEPPFHNPHLAKWLHRIGAPTRVIWGEADRFLPPDYAQALAKSIPGAEVSLLPGCGHMPHLERPAELAAKIGESIGKGRA